MGVLSVENWAEIRRLRTAEQVTITEIARRMGVARATVRRALARDSPPRYQRTPATRVVVEYEPRIRAQLAKEPRMPATVIAERISWPYSLSPLRKRVRELRPEYVGINPADRTVYEPGEIAQWDLWFPAVGIPVAPGQKRVLPVLVMTLGFSRFLAAVMIPSRQAGDILAGMWELIRGIGHVPRTLVWDREAAIGGTGQVTMPAAAFAGTLAAKILLAPPRDPEFKGLVERNNRYLETSFLPGREFTSPADFNTQLAGWLPKANARTVRSIQARPVDLLAADQERMLPLPPVAPLVGLATRVRLGRDYFVRVDTVDYSVHPRVIGRQVDVTASLTEVTVTCDGQPVARHTRSWAKHVTITDPAHRDTAAELRHELAARTRDRTTSAGPAGLERRHADGHPVALRALPDYDALFGVDFPVTTRADTTTRTESEDSR